MAAPSIQIYYNDARVKIAWEVDHTSVYRSFNVYWSVSSTMAGEVLLQGRIPNVDSSFYGKGQIFYEFERSIIGLTVANELYLRLKGVNVAGVEDAVGVGATRLIPSTTLAKEYNAIAQAYGYDYDKNLWKRVKVNDDGSLDVAVTIDVGVTGMPTYDIAPLFTNKSTLPLFAARVLTNAWQYSSSIATAGFGQAIVYMNYTLGAGDGTYQMQVQFSPDNAAWYDASYDALVAGNIVSKAKLYNYVASTIHRIAIPLADNYMKVGIYATGVGPAFGSVTANLTLGWN